MLLLCPSLLEDKHLLVQDLLPIHILHEDPEGLGPAVHSRIPLEIWCDRQLHHEAGARDGLNIGAQIKLGKLMDQLVDGLAHLGEANELTNLSTGQVIVALPGEVLLFHLTEDVLRNALEVPQWRLRSPHALIDHLAPIQSAQGECSPASSKADLKDGSHDAACRLLHVDHIREQGESFKLELGDVGLQEHVHLGGGFVSATLDGHRDTLHQLCKLHLLLLSEWNVFELVGQREKTKQLDVRHHWLEVVIESCNGRVLNVVVAGNTP
mmetsp:Transcript_58238/g.125947  ORF Transcript_58238/g.125947 Transcript_58238/m.125947 type:complete len:267 (-) Transcript_58238:3132-3932(-)